MKTIKSILLLAAFLLYSILSIAQQDTTVFAIVETMKATQGKAAEYVKAEKEVWKKIHQDRLKQGLILGWYFYEVKYPSGTTAPYDYVTVTFMRGLKRVEHPYGTLQFSDFSKMLNPEQLKVAQIIEQLRNLTTRSLYYTIDYVQADPKATVPAKFQMINQMKVKQGMGDAYVDTELKVVKPVFVEMMKTKTTGRAGWGLYGLSLPGGDNQVANYITSDFYNSMEDISKDTGYQKALDKMSMTVAEFSRKINEARVLINQELWELLDYAR